MPLSKEEENYVRLSLLITGISARSVRILFDGTFPPSSLEQIFKTNYEALNELRQKKTISSSQWSLMFPANQGTHESTKFDVTLMIAILRKLSKLTPPRKGYDEMPESDEATPAADLARIKWIRNELAHLTENKIETEHFKTAWDQISSAVLRLGNQQLKDECDELKSKALDDSNTQMMHEIQRSQEEIERSKAEIKNLQLEFDNFKIQLTNDLGNWHFKIPRNVKIQFASETSFNINWEPPENTDNLEGYRIYWKEKMPINATEFKDVPKEENCTIVDDLKEKTNYWIWISTYSLGKQMLAPTRQLSFQTTTGIPIKPPERVICTPNQSGRSVEISWEPPSSGEQMDHISGYTVYLQQHSDEREEEVKDTSVGSSVCRTVLEDLRPSTKYKIWISARSKNGHGPPSETKVIDTTVRKSNDGGINILSNVQHIDLGGGTIYLNFGGLPAQDIQGNVNFSNQMLSLNQQNQLSVNQANTSSTTSIESPDAAAMPSGENQST